MVISYSINSELRAKLKAPFGRLIRGSLVEIMNEMESIVKREKPPKIVSVGDIVSRNFHYRQMDIQLSITDNKCMRKKIKPQIFADRNNVYVRNPRGRITDKAIMAIRTALRSDNPTHIIVDGEEDMLALIAVLYAPEKSFVVYGQPHEGVVVVKVTSEKKAEVKKILKAMKTFES
jgi:uncharacterized protein (UPF0218 family)